MPAEPSTDPVSGFSIAHDFVDPLTTKFVEALPIVVGFLVLVLAVVTVIAFVRSRGRSIDGEHDDGDWYMDSKYDYHGD